MDLFRGEGVMLPRNSGLFFYNLARQRRHLTGNATWWTQRGIFMKVWTAEFLFRHWTKVFWVLLEQLLGQLLEELRSNWKGTKSQRLIQALWDLIIRLVKRKSSFVAALSPQKLRFLFQFVFQSILQFFDNILYMADLHTNTNVAHRRVSSHPDLQQKLQQVRRWWRSVAVIFCKKLLAIFFWFCR